MEQRRLAATVESLSEGDLRRTQRLNTDWFLHRRKTHTDRYECVHSSWLNVFVQQTCCVLLCSSTVRRASWDCGSARLPVESRSAPCFCLLKSRWETVKQLWFSTCFSTVATTLTAKCQFWVKEGKRFILKWERERRCQSCWFSCIVRESHAFEWLYCAHATPLREWMNLWSISWAWENTLLIDKLCLQINGRQRPVDVDGIVTLEPCGADTQGARGKARAFILVTLGKISTSCISKSKAPKIKEMNSPVEVKHVLLVRKLKTAEDS